MAGRLVAVTHHTVKHLEGMHAAVMIGPQFEDTEATYPFYRLQEEGAEVVLIGTEAGRELIGKRGQPLTTDRAASELSADDLDLLVIAGGMGPDKLRTDEGNWDWVFNNTPVFFIRDPAKFPHFIHTQKRHPQSHLKDADMFWVRSPSVISVMAR